MRIPILVAAVLAAIPAFAAGGAAPVPQPGRYALDAAACRAGDIFLTLKKDAIDLPVFSCRGLEYDQISQRGDGAIWAVSAKRCQGEMQARPGPSRFRIEAMGTTLRLHWADGTKSALMRRCGGV